MVKSTDETEKIKKRKNRKIVIIAVVIFLIMDLIMLAYIYDAATRPIPQPPEYWTISLNQTKVDDGYNLTIISIDPFPSEIDPSILEWRIMDNSGYIVYWNNFPLNGEKIVGSIYHNVSITWFDNDLNNKLTRGDKIYIYNAGIDMKGHIFNFSDISHGQNTNIGWIELE